MLNSELFSKIRPMFIAALTITKNTWKQEQNENECKINRNIIL